MKRFEGLPVDRGISSVDGSFDNVFWLLTPEGPPELCERVIMTVEEQRKRDRHMSQHDMSRAIFETLAGAAAFAASMRLQRDEYQPVVERVLVYPAHA